MPNDDRETNPTRLICCGRLFARQFAGNSATRYEAHSLHGRYAVDATLKSLYGRLLEFVSWAWQMGNGQD